MPSTTPNQGKTKLTKTRVESSDVVPDAGSRLLWDAELPGFGLRVTSNGHRAYIAQARVHGRTRRVTLGRHGVLTAEAARKRARQVLGKMADGIDPTAEKRNARAASVTLRELAEDYAENRRRSVDGKPLAARTKADIYRHLKSSFPDWADRPASSITREDVKRRYSKLGKRSHAQANQAVRIFSAIINYARGIYRDSAGQPVITDNPFDVVKDSGIRFPDAQRETSVPLQRAGQFYSALEATWQDEAAHPVTRVKAAAVIVLMLTGLRRSDVVDRSWAEVDLEEGVLLVPDGKHREERRFPLARQVVAILEELQGLQGSDFLFAGSKTEKPIGDIRAGLREANAAIGQHVAPHDLRRTFIEVSDRLDIDPLISELLSNRKGAAYQAMRTRQRHYAGKDLTRYREKAQRIADWFERERLAFEAGNVVRFEKGLA